MNACPSIVPKSAFPLADAPVAQVPVGRGAKAFVVPPGCVTRMLLEDIWERDGFGRLWMVTAPSERIEHVLWTLAVSHRPQLARVPSPEDAARTVANTVGRLGRGDVLVVVEDDVDAARAWLQQGASPEWS
jgi:hypothetical protein